MRPPHEPRGLLDRGEVVLLAVVVGLVLLLTVATVVFGARSELV